MHLSGQYAGASFTLEGRMTISFQVDEKEKALEEIESIKEEERLTIDVKKFRKRRSLDANGYFWQLVDKMAKKLGSDKWTIYLLQISNYGVFTDVAVVCEAVPILERTFRYTEILQEIDLSGKPGRVVRCYAGSSTYDTKEMGELIEGTVRDARQLGIETLTPDEQEMLISAWKGANFGNKNAEKQY